MRATIGSLAAVLAATFLASPVRAEVIEVKITKQPGVNYLPMVLVENEKLLEKEAKKAGLGDIKVTWITFKSGGASTDALLAGSVDLVTSGGTNLLLLWDKTKGDVKGVAGEAATPMLLLTRNDKIKTLKDFTAADKIAVPTVKVSTQAIVLQMAAEKYLGEQDRSKLDAMTVTMGHPDAQIALTSGVSEVNSHFSLEPYQTLEQKLPGVRAVVKSTDVLGGPASNGVVFTTTKFHDGNPKLIASLVKAMNDANELIAKDKKKAAQIYLDATKEKVSADDLVAILQNPNVKYSTTPWGTMKFAEFMFKVGILKTKPATWKDVYFPEVHKLAGN
ncbi:MAG: sulfonate transport system substrate-binding protein [Myxococcales bacterium]|jgi:NitT/TauT family transport system substrate-binding protein|nr:sulfonate transport system substrate-binding protein [Myxococcales bacterium]